MRILYRYDRVEQALAAEKNVAYALYGLDIHSAGTRHCREVARVDKHLLTSLEIVLNDRYGRHRQGVQQDVFWRVHVPEYIYRGGRSGYDRVCVECSWFNLAYRHCLQIDLAGTRYDRVEQALAAEKNVAYALSG